MALIALGFVLISNACSPIDPARSLVIPAPDLKATLEPDWSLPEGVHLLNQSTAQLSQVEKGEATYKLVCSPCHAYNGEGLTDEWRASWGSEKMNCWQSKCHASNHPPEGFDLPHIVPAVVGPNALLRYTTAADLHAVIVKSMPWYNPREITAEDDWTVTAYLMQANGVLPANITLDAGNAMVLRLQLPPTIATSEERSITIGALGFLIVAVITIVYRRTRWS